jgi:hypothetical protein
MSRKKALSSKLGFWLLCVRDTLFFIVVSVFPLAFILVTSKGLTWYELSGYLYGLVVPAIISILKNIRLSTVGITIKMLKIILFLSTFVMILFNKKSDLVHSNIFSWVLFVAVFVCVYYDIYKERKSRQPLYRRRA